MSVVLFRRTVRTVIRAAVALDIVFGGLVLAPTESTSAAVPYLGIGTTTIATKASAGRYIYVSTSGSDTVSEYKDWYNGGSYKIYQRQLCLDDPATRPASQVSCPEPTIDQPLRTIQVAIRIAKPGDVIIVRAGVYPEAAGWSARTTATPNAPIVLQSYPGERVELNGTLIMKNANYWNIRGIRFTHNSTVQTGQAIVAFAGGTGWAFENNEVSGSTGVANVLVEALGTPSSSTAPRDYRIAANCIHNNAGTGAAGTYHNIYLMSSIYSTGGLIERNLLAGAPRGSNIKVSASSSSEANDSPHNALIRYNTMLYSSSGVSIGLKAENISVEKNIIALPTNQGPYDGGVKTYQLAKPGTNAVKDTLINYYTPPIREDYGVTAHIFTARLNTTYGVKFSGSVANCSVKTTSQYVLSAFGQYAN